MCHREFGPGTLYIRPAIGWVTTPTECCAQRVTRTNCLTNTFPCYSVSKSRSRPNKKLCPTCGCSLDIRRTTESRSSSLITELDSSSIPNSTFLRYNVILLTIRISAIPFQGNERERKYCSCPLLILNRGRPREGPGHPSVGSSYRVELKLRVPASE